MRRLTLDDVARYPRPGLVTPGSFAFSPDGSRLTFLFSEEGTLRRVLHEVDLATGQARVLFDPGAGVTDENISREEALRRERQRVLHTGVTHYEWARDAPVILVPLGEELWIIDDGPARCVGQGALDPHLSPDGTRVAFVRDGDLWVLDVRGGGERRLTTDAGSGITNGTAEFVAQEEMGRARGFWWSPDGERIAYTQTDESQIPLFLIPHWGEDAYDVEEHRYPFAGADNSRVMLGVVDLAGGRTRWLDLGDAEYLARADWHPDGRLFAQVQDRTQRRLELRAFDARSGAHATLLVEQSDHWVNLHDDLRFVEDTGEFVWASERSGLKQLEVRSSHGALERVLTTDPWPVDAVVGFSSAGRRLAYAAATSPVERQLFAMSLDGGDPERLTQGRGMRAGAFSPDLRIWVEHADSVEEPPRVRLRGGVERELHAPATVDVALVTPEPFTFRARDGELLHGLLYRPERLPAPLLVDVYGGPHAQVAIDSWLSTVDLRAQYLVQQGFAVVSVDNRGSSRRGARFEAAIHRRMGTVEVQDQVDGVRFAQSQGWVDGDRVGIYGWSYGGYMTIMSMLKAPEVFRVGVAGAPVTFWEGYDTHYTERYMSSPQDNPEGYREASALTFAGRLQGRLLVVHGMIDENVHFRHTARLLEALQKANRRCDLLLYPGERHVPRSEADRRNMEERVSSYFLHYL